MGSQLDELSVFFWRPAIYLTIIVLFFYYWRINWWWWWWWWL